MLLLAFALAAPLTTPPPSRAQGVDVYINITGGGTKKLNIAIPEFTVTTAADPAAPGKLELPPDQTRRLAHKIADEIVLQFTGEPSIADTKIAYVAGPRGAKEILLADYDGFGVRPVTRNGSINLMPVWGPDARSLAYTSYKNGYPDLFRAFPFERRPEQTLAAFVGINSSPAFSPAAHT